jgi:cytochrome b involved in lipid metabolism
MPIMPMTTTPDTSCSSSSPRARCCCFLNVRDGKNKRRICAAGWLTMLVLGIISFGIVAVLFRRHEKMFWFHHRPDMPTTSSITLQELARHNTSEDCWTVLQQKVVYDVTAYADYHPNPQFITHHCGKDATSLFDSVHPIAMLKIIQRRQVGIFNDPTIAPEPIIVQTSGGRKQETTSHVITTGCDDDNKTSPTTISPEELLSHNSPTDDCWLAIDGIVYDVTKYAPFHPNPHFVTDYCGQDITALYAGAHARSRSVVKVVQQRCVGRLQLLPGTRANSGPTPLLVPDDSNGNDGRSQQEAN